VGTYPEAYGADINCRKVEPLPDATAQEATLQSKPPQVIAPASLRKYSGSRSCPGRSSPSLRKCSGSTPSTSTWDPSLSRLTNYPTCYLLVHYTACSIQSQLDVPFFYCRSPHGQSVEVGEMQQQLHEAPACRQPKCVHSDILQSVSLIRSHHLQQGDEHRHLELRLNRTSLQTSLHSCLDCCYQGSRVG
jgi:hypothetical protein